MSTIQTSQDALQAARDAVTDAQRAAALARLEAGEAIEGPPAVVLIGAMAYFHKNVWMGPESEVSTATCLSALTPLLHTDLAPALPAALSAMFVDKGGWVPSWDRLWDALVGKTEGVEFIAAMAPQVMGKHQGLEARQLLDRVLVCKTSGDTSPAVCSALAVLAGHSSNPVFTRAAAAAVSIGLPMLPHLHACIGKGVAGARKVRAQILADIPHPSSVAVIEGRLAVEKSKAVRPVLEAALLACQSPAPAAETALPEVLGKTVALVGRFPNWPTDTFRAHLELLGASSAKSVSKRVDMVFTGKGGDAKADKARQLGIPVYDLDTLQQVLAAPLPAGDLPTVDGLLGDYLVRFTRMVQALKNHKNAVVLHFSHAPPAPASAIAAAEAALGAPMDPALKHFYQQCNGLKLYWTPRSQYSDDLHPTSDDPARFVSHNVEVLGCVDILPVEQVFGDWSGAIGADSFSDDDTISHRGQELPAGTFHRQLHFFDVFGTYRYMALRLVPGTSPAEVLMCDDHGATWLTCHVTDVASYLESVLINFGSTAGRRRFLARESGNKHAVIYEQAQWYRMSPGLEKLLKGMR